VPLIGSEEFHIASTTLVASFIISFGVIKAFANLFSGHLADVLGPQARADSGVAVRCAGSLHDHRGAKLGVGDCRQCAARHQSGTSLVDDRHLEG
jgi:hypothetical protein